MEKVFLIVWIIVAVLLLAFEFYAGQEVKRAIGTDKKKIANYKSSILWNIILLVFFVASVIGFFIIDPSAYNIAIMLSVLQTIRSVVLIIKYSSKRKSEPAGTDL